MRLRVGLPVWLNHPEHQVERYPGLRGTIDADVVIVGGGMTAAGIAFVFAEAGLRVVVAEAARVGRGSTAASTALLMQETDEDLTALTQRYGPARAQRIWELSRAATRDLADTLRRLRIACDLAPRDAVYYTSNPDVVRRLQAECRRRRRGGFSATWLDRAELLAQAGIAGEGAIRSHGGAQYDPYRACHGLLRSAARRGARIFEQSPVGRVDTSPDGVIVRTPAGSVSAARAIIATGYATPAFAPLARRFRMKHTYVLATRPMTRGERKRVRVGDLLLWDTAHPYHYARWTHDHRLLLGGNDRPVVAPARRRTALAESTADLREYFENLLPPLKDIGIEYAWEGLFAVTPDGLPFIGPHRRYPRQLFALGYGGNGMTFGFLAARLLLDAFLDAPGADHQLFAFNRWPARKKN